MLTLLTWHIHVIIIGFEVTPNPILKVWFCLCAPPFFGYNNQNMFILRRGGIHPIFGLYVRGDALMKNYTLASFDSYPSTSHLRSEKRFQVTENLYTLSTTTPLHSSSIGNWRLLNRAVHSSLNSTRMHFYMPLAIVKHFNLESLFYIKNTNEEIKYLQEEPHNFTLTSVMEKHSPRLVEPEPVLEGLANAQQETTTFVNTCFRCYDTFEMYNFSLSRLGIEYLVHPDLCADVLVQHSHVEEFLKLQ